jgi:hypothetical protein
MAKRTRRNRDNETWAIRLIRWIASKYAAGYHVKVSKNPTKPIKEKEE